MTSFSMSHLPAGPFRMTSFTERRHTSNPCRLGMVPMRFHAPPSRFDRRKPHSKKSITSQEAPALLVLLCTMTGEMTVPVRP